MTARQAQKNPSDVECISHTASQVHQQQPELGTSSTTPSYLSTRSSIVGRRSPTLRHIPKAGSDPVAGLCGHAGWKRMLGPHRERACKSSGSGSVAYGPETDDSDTDEVIGNNPLVSNKSALVH